MQLSNHLEGILLLPDDPLRHIYSFLEPEAEWRLRIYDRHVFKCCDFRNTTVADAISAIVAPCSVRSTQNDCHALNNTCRRLRDLGSNSNLCIDLSHARSIVCLKAYMRSYPNIDAAVFDGRVLNRKDATVLRTLQTVIVVGLSKHTSLLFASLPRKLKTLAFCGFAKTQHILMGHNAEYSDTSFHLTVSGLDGFRRLRFVDFFHISGFSMESLDWFDRVARRVRKLELSYGSIDSSRFRSGFFCGGWRPDLWQLEELAVHWVSHNLLDSCLTYFLWSPKLRKASLKIRVSDDEWFSLALSNAGCTKTLQSLSITPIHYLMVHVDPAKTAHDFRLVTTRIPHHAMPKSVRAISSLYQLETLKLERVIVFGPDIKVVMEGCPKLTKLSLCSCNVKFHVAEVIGSSSLTHVVLSGSRLSPYFLKAMSWPSTVIGMDLVDCDLSDNSAIIIAVYFPKLEALNISKNNITRQGRATIMHGCPFLVNENIQFE